MDVLTCHVGSWPKPADLRRARARHAEGDLEDAALHELERRAVRDAIADQVERGLREVTDGHPDRGDLVAGFALRLRGVESAGPVRVLGSRYAVRPRIVERPARDRAVTVDRFREAAAATERTVRVTLPSPYTLALGCLDEVHRRREEAVEALTGPVAVEVRDLVRAGARSIQIDEIGLGAVPGETGSAVEAIGRVARAAAEVDPGAEVRVRLAYVPFAPVADRLYGLPIAGLALGWNALDDEGLVRLADAPGRFDLGVGVVAADDPEVESVDDVRRRIDRFAGAAGRGTVWAHPDAGFLGIDAATARAKLDVLEAAAR